MLGLENKLSEDERISFAMIVARAWDDESFAREYAQAPRAVLAAHGIGWAAAEDVPDLPARPELELSVEDLTATGVGIEAISITCWGTGSHGCMA